MGAEGARGTLSAGVESNPHQKYSGKLSDDFFFFKCASGKFSGGVAEKSEPDGYCGDVPMALRLCRHLGCAGTSLQLGSTTVGLSPLEHLVILQQRRPNLTLLPLPAKGC